MANGFSSAAHIPLTAIHLIILVALTGSMQETLEPQGFSVSLPASAAMSSRIAATVRHQGDSAAFLWEAWPLDDRRL